jgi:HK97 family phage prohead protease
MSQVVVGAISDTVGAASRRENYRDESRGVLFGSRRVYWGCPADRFRPTQPPDIPLQAGHHGPRIGSVVALELRAGKLWVVAETVDGVDLTRQPWQLSYDLVERPDGLFDLDAVAVVDRSSTICLGPIQVRDGTVATVVGKVVAQDGILDPLIRNAHEDRRRRRRGPVEIRGAAAPAASMARPLLEYRSAIPVDTSTARRTIDLIVMPYESETVIRHEGRTVREIVSRGAFDGIEHETRKVRVNRDHERARTVGKAVAFDPNHPGGLYAILQIADTELGRETLTLADEGVLDASAGFAVLPGGERWEHGGNRRRLTKLFLDHIALTPDPAYADATVLGVRSAALLAR